MRAAVSDLQEFQIRYPIRVVITTDDVVVRPVAVPVCSRVDVASERPGIGLLGLDDLNRVPRQRDNAATTDLVRGLAGQARLTTARVLDDREGEAHPRLEQDVLTARREDIGVHPSPENGQVRSRDEEQAVLEPPLGIRVVETDKEVSGTVVGPIRGVLIPSSSHQLGLKVADRSMLE